MDEEPTLFHPFLSTMKSVRSLNNTVCVILYGVDWVEPCQTSRRFLSSAVEAFHPQQSSLAKHKKFPAEPPSLKVFAINASDVGWFHTKFTVGTPVLQFFFNGKPVHLDYPAGCTRLVVSSEYFVGQLTPHLLVQLLNLVYEGIQTAGHGELAALTVRVPDELCVLK
eukprot:TRINITY_DN66498_c7_g1_i1.p1 TRINITY_DN66498_c7_g1~~TRINITY_DN66498_c7_g1_i1.p1  ORF type:complete len:175 (+),score=9.90 TRINITY_DN66498_c7_g1_i1:26-526(+)